MYCITMAKRFDQTFMAAILTIFHYGAFIPLTASIGFMFFAYRSESPEMKKTAVKCFFLFVFMYVLLPAAEAGGFA